MKNFIVASLLLFPLLSNSQVKTGGGTGTVIDDKPEYGGGGGRNGVVILGEYIKNLKAREMQCGEKKRVFFKSEDFMKSYVSLSVYASLYSEKGNANKEQCDFAAAFLDCLNDEKSKALYKELIADKEIRGYLKIKYEINDSEVEKMLKFFEKFEAPKK